MVGGAVRDALLGLDVGERDWLVVGATPEAMIEAGFRPVGRHFPVFLHPRSGEEYALARTERKSAPGHGGFVFHCAPDVSLEDDLSRRDLRINAMAQDESGNIIDPHGGREDLAARRLRHVSPAFVEDPLRVLRLARFAAQLQGLGFAVADDTMELCAGMVRSGELGTLSGERVWGELWRAFNTPAADAFLAVLERCGALGMVAPGAADAVANARERLRAAASGGERDAQILLALFYGRCIMGGGDLDAINMRIPADTRRIMELVGGLAPLASADILGDAGAMLGLLDRLDAWRRPEAARSFFRAAWHLLPDAADPGRACAQLDAALPVRVKDLRDLDGRKIRRILDERRRAALQAAG